MLFNTQADLFTKINMYSMPLWSIVRFNTCTYGIMAFMVKSIRVHEKNTDVANLFIINNPLNLELFKRSFSTLQNLKQNSLTSGLSLNKTK